jgi:L-ascorbate metabolism protein UlaG (beta-lactamase superfamily)
MKTNLLSALLLSPMVLFLVACSPATPKPYPTFEPDATATYDGSPVTLEYIGHDCFVLATGDGTKIVMDPYKTGNVPTEISKFPDNLTANLVTISHFHPDHDNLIGIGGKPRADYQPGSDSVGLVKITGYKSDHGYTGGVPAGDNTVFVFEVGGAKIVHMGAAGVITQTDILAAIQNADVAIIDAMGTDSHPVQEMMAQLRKSGVRTVIPAHNSFSEDNLYYDSLTVDGFLKLLSADEKVTRMDGSTITILPGMPIQVLVMTPLALSLQ